MDNNIDIVKFEVMKKYAKIANEALMKMALMWEQIQFNNEEPIELIENYPIEKSFDEFVFDFSNWISEWI